MNIKLLPLYCLTLLLLTLTESNAQIDYCDKSKVSGPNLVVNGGFEDGNTGFYTDISCSWNDPACSCHNNQWSEPDQYYIGTSPSENTPCGGRFQSAFVGSPRSGSMFMMVDGKGNHSPIVWEQEIAVQDSSYYYFETWITTIGTTPDTYARLRFVINGIMMPEVIDAPLTPGQWINYSQLWYSGVTKGTITIQIIDTQPNADGPDRDDFGLDDITFALGCPPDSYVEQPDLGPDLSFCGTDATSFTLDPNVTLNVGQSLTWSTGPADAGRQTIEVSSAGTYYVCINQAGSCTKLDSIVVTDKFIVDLGNDIELCDPAALMLDAVHSGPNVTYQWYKDDVPLVLGKGKTLYVNEEGEYKVVVTDPKCETQTDSTIVSLKSNQPIPNNVPFCLTSNPDTTIRFSVSPPGTNYAWYDAEGNLLADSTWYYDLAGITLGDTLYARDITVLTHPVTGPSYSTATSQWYSGNISRTFNALSDLTIESVYMRSGSSYYSPNTSPCYNKASGTQSEPFRVQVLKDGVLFTESDPVTVTCGGTSGPGPATQLTINLDIPAGNNYALNVLSDPVWTYAGSWMYNQSNSPAYSIAGVIDIPAKSDNSGVFFDWTIKTKNTCSSVPVFAYDICILPVEFVYVRAVQADDNIRLYWATATEKNNSHFEIERLVAGDWITIGRVEGHGDSKDLILYDFTDYHAPKGVAYYRIKQVDFDGDFAYSDVITVENTSLYTLLRPNPSSGAAYLSVIASNTSVSNLTVHDALGKLIESREIPTNQEIRIGENYPRGVYMIRVWNGSDYEVIKFIRK